MLSEEITKSKHIKVVLSVCAFEKEQKHVGDGLVSLAKSGTTVGTPSLAQCKAEEDPEGEEEDGTQDAQACEVILQDAHSACWTAAHHHY